jgi:hypothetical protein
MEQWGGGRESPLKDVVGCVNQVSPNYAAPRPRPLNATTAAHLLSPWSLLAPKLFDFDVTKEAHLGYGGFRVKGTIC